MTSPISFVGGEDFDFLLPAGLVAAGSTGVSVNTTAGYFRAGYARCAMVVMQNTNPPTFGRTFQSPIGSFSHTDFWTTAQLFSTLVSGAIGNSTGDIVMQWSDSSNIPRIRIRNANRYRSTSSGVDAYPPIPLVVEKLDAAGTATQLGSNTTPVFSVGTMTRIDVHINYAVAGEVSIYINGSLLFTYTGNVTTNSVTSLGSVVFGGPVAVAVGRLDWGWSEMAVSPDDTRRVIGIVTTAPSANGATDQWTGTASDISEIVLSDVTVNYTDTAAFVQEYTISSLPSGVYGIMTVVSKLRAAAGAGAPQNIDHIVRIGGVDYASPDQSLTGAFAMSTYNWDTNPATGGGWTQAVLSAGTFNWGFRSAV